MSDIPTFSPGNNGSYGAEILPSGPLQDMEASLDLIVGSVHDRSASQAEFTGGGPEVGFGGTAEGTEDPGVKVP